MERLSVVIPAYRRHPLTARAVEESMKSSRLPDEIIVVNDGGDPSLREMIFSLRRTVPIVYARINEDIPWNYNGAVNLGAWISKGDYLMIQDTDHIPGRDCYRNAINILEEQSDVGRVAFHRSCVDVEEVMKKPMEEWTVLKTWGSNQMVTMLRREVYITLKGQDERFSGNYGWMCYSWVNRYKNILKVKSAMAKSFWAVIGDGGEPGMNRAMNNINYRIYREGAASEMLQFPTGILNFTYTIETWPRAYLS